MLGARLGSGAAGGVSGSGVDNTSQNTSAAVIETFMRDDFQLVRPIPADTTSLQREIRFSMNYCQANKLN